MTTSRSRQFGVEDLFDLEAFLEHDRGVDEQQLHDRDREIGQQIEAAELPDHKALYGWLKARREQDPDLDFGNHVERFRYSISWLLFILGIATACGMAGGNWMFSADNRVDARLLWFWFVVPLWGFLLISLLATLPLSRKGRLREGLVACFVPFGQLLAWPFRRSQQYRERVDRWLGLIKRTRHLYGRIWTWQIIEWVHAYKFWHTLALLGAWVAWVHYDDPMFYWKSLTDEPAVVAGRVAWIAKPWQSISKSFPTEEDIRVTQWNSSQGDFMLPGKEQQAQRLEAARRWSRYLFYNILFFGFVPRLGFLAYARWNRKRALAKVSLTHSAIRSTLDRMRSPRLQFHSDQPDGSSIRDEACEVDRLPSQLAKPTSSAVFQCASVKLSAEKLEEILQKERGDQVQWVLPWLGGELTEGEASWQALAQISTEVELQLVVAASESPMGEHLDLIGQLRARTAEKQFIRVLLYDEDSNDQPRVAPLSSRQIWANKLNPIGDPWVDVDSLVRGVAQ